MPELAGRVAVVTGAASGIGYGLAERFAREGMKVVLADVEEKALRQAELRLGAGGAKVVGVTTDVSDAGQMDRLAESALDAFGGVHVLCNNAGVSIAGPVWETSAGDWDWILGVNLVGVVNGIRAFTPILIEQDWGHIVNTASIAGLIPGVLGAYSVTKHAVVALSESLHYSLQVQAPHVGVSVLCPGWVRTRIIDSNRNRPARYGPEREPDDDPTVAAVRAGIEALVASGMEPAEVAGKVVDAIQEARFYIVTHPDMLPGVERRMEAILNGGPPPPPTLA